MPSMMLDNFKSERELDCGAWYWQACLGDALEMVRKDVAQRRAFGKQQSDQESVPAAELAEGSSYDVLL